MSQADGNEVVNLIAEAELGLVGSPPVDPVVLAHKLDLDRAVHRVALFLLARLYGERMHPHLVKLYLRHSASKPLRELICFCLATAPYDAVTARQYSSRGAVRQYWQAILNTEIYEAFTEQSRNPFTRPDKMDWREVAAHYGMVSGAINAAAVVDDLARRERTRVESSAAPTPIIEFVNFFASREGRSLLAQIIRHGSQEHVNYVSGMAMDARPGDYPEVFGALQDELDRNDLPLPRRRELLSMISAFKDADNLAGQLVPATLAKLPRGILSVEGGSDDKATIYSTALEVLRDPQPVLETLDAEITALLADRSSRKERIHEWAHSILYLLADQVADHPLKRRIASRALQIEEIEGTPAAKLALAILNGKQ